MTPAPSQELLDALHAIANHSAVISHGLDVLQEHVDLAGREVWNDCDEAASKLIESVRHAQELVRRG